MTKDTVCPMCENIALELALIEGYYFCDNSNCPVIRFVGKTGVKDANK